MGNGKVQRTIERELLQETSQSSQRIHHDTSSGTQTYRQILFLLHTAGLAQVVLTSAFTHARFVHPAIHKEPIGEGKRGDWGGGYLSLEDGRK